jgi:hypothetical protein
MRPERSSLAAAMTAPARDRLAVGPHSEVKMRPASTRAAGDARRRPSSGAVGLLPYIGSGSLASLATIPFIYSLIAPLVALDLWVTVYQWVCFPLYGIARVRRRDHVVIDRYRLPYLNAIEKVNCVYCGYATAVLAYAAAVAARTEQYWCPIRHQRLPKGRSRTQQAFAAYGDAEGYRRRVLRLRSRLRSSVRAARPRRGNR